MKRKWLAIALSMALAVGMLSGCGDSNEEATTAPAADEGSSDAGSADAGSADAGSDEGSAEEPAVELLEDGGGKVLNIYVWNDEWKTRFEKYYPDYKDGKVGDVTVNFIQNANEGSNYQDKLDEALSKQESASADDKVDIFLAEADYIDKYKSAAADLAVPVEQLGITDADMAEMYDYTRQAATDENGVQRGVSWQACAAGMIYRRSKAKKYFGTDDPAEVQNFVSDWDKFKEACEKIRTESKGKEYMLFGPDDMQRIFTNNDSTKFVNDGVLAATPGLNDWADTMKEYCDAGYIQDPAGGLWSEEWGKAQSNDGKVFAFFGPAWYIYFCMTGYSGASQKDDGTWVHKDGKDSYGDWALCQGPQSFNWGGTWILAAKGTDNAALVGDIMKKMTCDQDILYNISKDNQDYVNGKAACDKLIADGITSDFLGGQDLISSLKEAAEAVSMTNLSPYDQQCIENSQAQFKDFFTGKVSKEDATKKWQDEVIKAFPNLTAG
ncbi:MAG: carbohydrate ABC transporter substrate-binding protein [Eubacterium sp.]|nr:carbohydrate ABC transporter substrate-binding protein [Eubacterium sp.]